MCQRVVVSASTMQPLSESAQVMGPEQVRLFRRRLLTWAGRNGRDFWWRHQRDLYTTAVVEVMLKQTRAEGTDHKIKEFLSRYPRPESLASAHIDDLERDLQPFGLYRQRARQLVALGQHMTSPKFKDGWAVQRLSAIPGIGPYSLAAIRCFVYGKRDAVIDVNVVRIIQRVFGLSIESGELRKSRRLSSVAQALANGPRPRQFNWAMLDLGATVCTARNPKCERCPLKSMCRYARSN
jgi:A/G-specific adenine glycosylase